MITEILLQQKTMLIVDDFEMNRDILQNIFKDEFYILQAENGIEAMKLLHEKKTEIDIVLLDLVMPEKDGFSVLKEVRAHEELSNIPIVVVSASGEIDGELLSLELGATDFIVKPIKPHIARLRVQNILARKEVDKLRIQHTMMIEQHQKERVLLNLITQSKNEYQRLAEYDQLTGIYNKTMFVQETKKMLQKNPDITYVLVRFDIEKFKVINEFLGHKEGDALLKHIASILKKYVSKIGTYGRIASDVFVACFPHSNENVEKMIQTYADSMKLYNLNLEIILCFGLYVITDPEVPIDSMIDRANLALQTIKGNYITRFAYYDEALRQILIEEQEIVNEMEDALQNGQFKMYLQPKCDLKDGTIVGAEALVRWFHPKKGIIPPGKFIPIFEKNGFVMALDQFIWEEVCKLLKKWIDEGSPVLPISVNISRVNLFNPQLASIIKNLAEKYGIPPRLLELEITESAYTNNAYLLVDLIHELHENGFTVLMDDFGSGYSSLNMLKEIPVDALKIDLHFLSGSDILGRGEQILESIVNMSHAINLQTIVEGVETKDQVDFLQSIRCNRAQGFYFYRPMPIEEFEETLHQKTAEKSNSLEN
ncbi:MAG TPA: EAL domain-containing protein [Treponemataceae bacterium]|nr:EAL domain-containing protein [Treponemataceae bacterium]